MRIAELARRGGVNLQTVRYYERRGLLRDPRQGARGYREYDDGDLSLLRFVKQAQALGFTLAEARELLALRSGAGTAADVRERAREKLDGVREKISALRALERNLLRLIAGCRGSGPASACSIIHRLAATEDPGPKAGKRRRST